MYFKECFLETGQRKTLYYLQTKYFFCLKPPLIVFPKFYSLPHSCTWWTRASSAAWWPSLFSMPTWLCWSSSTSLWITTPITNQQKHGLVRGRNWQTKSKTQRCSFFPSCFRNSVEFLELCTILQSLQLCSNFLQEWREYWAWVYICQTGFLLSH